MSPVLEAETVAITDPSNEQQISKISWSPDGRSIAFLSADELSSKERSKETIHDDAYIYHSQWNCNRLRVVCVENRTVRTLSHKDRHVTDFAWNWSSDELLYVSQMTPDVNSPWENGVVIERVTLDTELFVHLITFPGELSHLTWCKSQVFFLAGKTPEKVCSAGTIYRMTQNGEGLIQYAFGDKDCAKDLKWLADLPAAHVQQGLEDRIYHLCETSPNLVYSGLHQINAWDIAGNEKRGWTLAIAKGSSSKPTEIFSVQGSNQFQLSKHGQTIANLEFGSGSPFYASAGDGVDLDGILLTPTMDRSNPLPTVVSVHGGPPARVNSGFDCFPFHWEPWLASKGYAVLCPNYRGSTSHGEDFVAHSRGGWAQKTMMILSRCYVQVLKEGSSIQTEWPSPDTLKEDS